MSFDVKIIADSVGPNGARLTTFALKYPRFIHSEIMTHRAFSRSASSSRAVPTAEVIRRVVEDPAIPIHWGKNQKGMQAERELTPEEQARCREKWLAARDDAVARARELLDLGLHKQVASRILEPFSHIHVVLSATTFTNFFALRVHPDAQPEFQYLSALMAVAYRGSRPTPRLAGEWHLPYVRTEEWDRWDIDALLQFSVARCARVSYLKHDGGEPDPVADATLAGRLMESGHWSPAEHQGRAGHRGPSGNFRGWLQYRQTLPINTHQSFDSRRADEVLKRFA